METVGDSSRELISKWFFVLALACLVLMIVYTAFGLND